MNLPTTIRHRSCPRTVVAVVVVLAASLAACSSGPPGPPPASAGTLVSLRIPAPIADLPLIDQHGAVTDLAKLRGTTLMLVPFLTLCQDMCPFDTGNLLQVQQAIDLAGVRSAVTLVEISVDPGRDSPARLAAYAQLVGAHWLLLTETPSTLNQLERFFGWWSQTTPEDSPPAVDWWTHQPLTYDVNHSDGYTLVDAAGVERYATGASPDFSGTLNPTLHHFLSPLGRSRLAHPPQPGWTPTDALAALSWVLQKHLPTAGG